MSEPTDPRQTVEPIRWIPCADDMDKCGFNAAIRAMFHWLITAVIVTAIIPVFLTACAVAFAWDLMFSRKEPPWTTNDLPKNPSPMP